MKIALRADSSAEMGSGHLMRCLTLADDLQQKENEILFICRNLPGNLIDIIEKKGYSVARLPYNIENRIAVDDIYLRWLGVSPQVDAAETEAIIKKEQTIFDLLVIDHYGLDRFWEEKIQPYVKKILVIDDLANRPHNCNILLDQNFYEHPEKRYKGLIPSFCKELYGPRYSLLRPEFRKTRKYLKSRNGIIGKILVFFGGSDLSNETNKVLYAIKLLNNSFITFDIVVGFSNPHKEHIRRECQNIPNTRFFCQIENMAQLMAEADLAVGAGGTTTWERCFLGLPSIVEIIAKNQEETTNAVGRLGAIWNLGWYANVSITDIAKAIEMMLVNPALLKEISNKAFQLMDDNVNIDNNFVLSLLDGGKNDKQN